MKKVLIWVGILVALFVAYGMLNFFYLTRLASPKEVVEYQENDLAISLEYCRPSKKGRLIFGNEEAEALVPFGKYWRLGANEATEIDINRSISIDGKNLNKGRYRVYAIPGESSWELVFNSQLGKWGYSEADHDMDVLRVSRPVEELQEEVEMFTITILKDRETTQPTLNFFWDRTLVRLPFSYE